MNSSEGARADRKNPYFARLYATLTTAHFWHGSLAAVIGRGVGFGRSPPTCERHARWFGLRAGCGLARAGQWKCRERRRVP